MEKRINLTKVIIPELDGTQSEVDLSKTLASPLYNTAKTLPVVLAAQDLYKTGECEKSDEVIAALRGVMNALDFGYVVVTAIESHFA